MLAGPGISVIGGSVTSGMRTPCRVRATGSRSWPSRTLGAVGSLPCTGFADDVTETGKDKRIS